MNLEAPLSRLFDPRVVAIVGASEDDSKYGSQALRNLLESEYAGRTYCIDPKRRDFGERVITVASGSEIDEPIDVVFLAIPAAVCPEVVSDLSGKCIFAIVAVSGFEGDGSAPLRKQLMSAAGSTRIIGPNCNGVYGAVSGVSIGYNHGHGTRWSCGDVAVISQSGAIFSDIASLVQSCGLGINQFVSAGDEMDLTFCDYLENALHSEGVKAVLCALDGIQEPQRFADCLEQAEKLGIDVVVVKFGNAAGSSAFTQAHVGRMAGSSAVAQSMCSAFSAVFATSLREGILALRLLRSGRDQMRRIHAASTSGAGAMMMKDAAGRHEIAIAPLDHTVSEALGAGQFSQTLNPYDLGAHGVAGAQRAFEAFALAPGPIIVHLTPPPTAGWQTAQSQGLRSLFDKAAERTYLVSLSTNQWLEQLAAEHGVPVLVSLDEFFTSARAVQDTTGTDEGATLKTRGSDAMTIILDEQKSRRYLDELGLDISLGRRVDRETDLDGIDYPVAVKGLVPGVAHKNDRGLVALDIADRPALKDAMFEMGRLEPGVEGFLLLPMADPGPELILGWRREEGTSQDVLVGGAGGLRTEKDRDIFVVGPDVFRGRARKFWGTLNCWADLSEAQREALIEFSQSFAGCLGRIDERTISIEMNPVRLTKSGTKSFAIPLDALVEMSSHEG